MKHILLVSLILILQSTNCVEPNILLLCNPSAVSQEYWCGNLEIAINNLGYSYTRLNDTQLTDEDFIGINVYIDGSIDNSGDCGFVWNNKICYN